MSAASVVDIAAHTREANGDHSPHFPVPMRNLLRVCLHVLAVQSEDPGAHRNSSQRGDNGVRVVAQDILETYVRDEFLERIGTSPAAAEKFIRNRMAQGDTEEKAIRHLLRVLHAEEKQ